MADIQEALRFQQMLYHDNHDSYFCTLEKYTDNIGETQVEQNFSKDFTNKFSNYRNYYTSLNGFARKTRRKSSVRELNAIYFDLDLHDDTPEMKQAIAECDWLNRSIAKTVKIIKEELPVQPTLIVKTGRGLGLYYIFHHSVAVHTRKTRRSKSLYQFIWKCYGEIIDNFLNYHMTTWNEYAVPDVLQLDKSSIGDVSRVVRIPGTVNQNNDALCEIIETGNYYNMRDIAETIPEYTAYIEWKKTHSIRDYKKKKKKKKRAVQRYNALCLARIRFLEKLQEEEFNHAGRHHNMCFLYYNHAKQLYKDQDAKQMTIEFNNNFKDYSKDDLHSMMKSVDRASNMRGDGYYLISNNRMADMLGILPEEYNRQMDMFRKKAKRDVKRKEKESEKKIREKAIKYDVLYTRMTYSEIAEKYGVSLSTINRFVKKHNIERGLNWMAKTNDTPVVHRYQGLLRYRNTIEKIRKAKKGISELEATIVLYDKIKPWLENLISYRKQLRESNSFSEKELCCLKTQIRMEEARLWEYGFC